jgi:protein-S-isoprenylcysteine O-methyltransferase Ste14
LGLCGIGALALDTGHLVKRGARPERLPPAMQKRYQGTMRVPKQAVTQSAMTLAVLAAALFVPAGTLRIPEFWLYIAIFAVMTAASLLLLPPDLIEERMRPGGEKPSPVYFFVALVPLLHWIAAGLDYRFHWTHTVPGWLQAAAFLALMLGFALFFWGMAVNRFFSSVPRIQSERGHHVVTSGPYRFVRHPGYIAAIVIVLASGPALGSWLAALAFTPAVFLLLSRTLREDAQLKAELPGYRDYAEQVRWRWVPGVW